MSGNIYKYLQKIQKGLLSTFSVDQSIVPCAYIFLIATHKHTHCFRKISFDGYILAHRTYNEISYKYIPNV